MDELVEGVLPIGPRLAPHDWSSVVVDAGAIFGDVLPIGLHVALKTKQTGHQRRHSSRARNSTPTPQSVRFLRSAARYAGVTPADPPPCVTDLLEVGGEAVHVLVVGQHGVGLCLEEVDVPDAEHGE